MINKITILVLCYGEHFLLAQRCLSSIVNNFDKSKYILRVGLNKVCEQTKNYVLSLPEVDDVYISKRNIHKINMWRRMSKDIETDWFMWFDDDSHVIDKDALDKRLDLINKNNFDMAGHVYYLNLDGDHYKDYIRNQSWYKNKPIPCGVLNYEEGFNLDGNEKRWFFLTGGNWIAKTKVLEEFQYPCTYLAKANVQYGYIPNDGDDVLICEILRQNNYKLFDIGELGIKINDSCRRGLHDLDEAKKFIQNLN